MSERAGQQAAHPPAGSKVALLRAASPPVAFYRFLYHGIGERWCWHQRRALSDEALAEILQDEQVGVYVLYVDGSPAGYAELDRREAAITTLAYIGLMPDYLGRGFGRFLLQSAIRIAWSQAPERLRVATNSLEHPAALSLLQRSGFSVYRREERPVEDPQLLSLLES